MRLAMLMRDTEYRDAMIGMISVMYKDIFVEIADASGAARGALIITDIMPEELGEEVVKRLCRRTIFLSSVPVRDRTEGSGIRIFKYSGLSEIMSAAFSMWTEWTGDSGGTAPISMSIAVCAESDLYCSIKCRSLARQIIYRKGGRILILPLGHINDYLFTEAGDGLLPGGISRLMYMIDAGRDYHIDSFTVSDSYGISYLRLPEGPNPIAGFDSDHLISLVRSLGTRFDSLILDVGTCYRKENLELISGSGEIFWFGTGRRISDPSVIIGNRDRIRSIDITDQSEEARRLDDAVCDIYGIDTGREDVSG